MPRASSVLLLLLVGGCFPGPRPYDGPWPDSDPAPYVGCYQVTYSEPVPGGSSGWWMRLDSEPASSEMPGGANGLPARRAKTSNQRHNDPFWRLIPSGFQLHSGDTLHGAYTEFSARGDSLVGRMFFYSDVMSGFGIERVSAHRVPCGNE